MAREKAATIVVFLEDGSPESHDLASDRDWSVIFEDVLEIKGREATTYYPLDAVRKWTVHAKARLASPVDRNPLSAPGRARREAKDESKARSWPSTDARGRRNRAADTYWSQDSQ